MPAAPRSPQSKKTGARKVEGAVRAKSGCYTCRTRRIRRKRIDGHQDGHCETCVRLRLQCLGFGAKRPEWLRESRNVSEMRDKIKAFLAAQGMIKGHSGSVPCESILDLPEPKRLDRELKSHSRSSPRESVLDSSERKPLDKEFELEQHYNQLEQRCKQLGRFSKALEKELKQVGQELKQQEQALKQLEQGLEQLEQGLEQLEQEFQQLERERERRERKLLRRIQCAQLLEAPPEGLILKLLSSLVFIMLAILALELVGWFLFLGLLITILAYLLLIISFASTANIEAPSCTQEILYSAARLIESTRSVGHVILTHLLPANSPAHFTNTPRGADRKITLRSRCTTGVSTAR